MRFSLNLRERNHRWLAPFLALLLALPPSMGSQAAAQSVPPAVVGNVQSLRVIPLAGDGEMNDVARKVMAPLVVQVLDQESRPVEGADVTFTFPASGPSAAFADGKASQTVKTNVDGQAAAVSWTANQMVGRLQIQVAATRGNELGVAVISMINVTKITAPPKAKRWYSSKWVKIGAIAAAVAVVAIVVIVETRGKSTTTITAVPGFPTIGGGQ